ncbi:hypothetical protein JYU34_006563 [Plutella xylostella]|uniref:Uncharacterized protein n=1 Tax=Plutella xylostella TaxID=51655 RepID=A0ABQ7QSA3_PLUXY|nr:hypothetical protein JYU34_006563 [Plutella xylostella]
MVEKMANYAVKIAYYNFEWRYITLVICTTVHAIGVETFMKNYDKSVVLKMGEYVPKRTDIQQYVLFGEETPDIIRLLEFIAKMHYNNAGKFIILCVSLQDGECNEYEVLKLCMNYHITNVVFIKGGQSDEPVTFTYHPVIAGRCFNSDPEVMAIASDCPNDDCFKGSFPEKLSNMLLCPIMVSTFEQHPFMYLNNGSGPLAGVDGEILSLLMDVMNATLRIITPTESSWGHYKNNNWTGSVGDVFNGRAHFSMCSAPLTYNKYGNFQISFTYNSMDMVWVAGHPPAKPSWAKLLYPLKIYIRLLIFIMFIIIILLNFALKTQCWQRAGKLLKITPPKLSMLFYAWVAFLGLPLARYPKKPALLMIVLWWIIFTFLIRSVYQAALIGTLKHRVYDGKFQSFEDVLRSKRPFGGSSSLKEYYSDEPHIYRQWQDIRMEDIYSELDAMAGGTSDFVIAANEETVLEYLIYYSGSKVIQIIPRKIVNSPTVLFFRKYSPLAVPVNKLLSSISECGFAGHLYYQYKERALYIFRRPKSSSAEPLRLEHFTGSYCIIVGGWCLSVFFFLIEVYAVKLDLVHYKYVP